MAIMVGNRELRLLEYEGKYRIEVGKTGKGNDGSERWWPNRVKEYEFKGGKQELKEKDSNVKIPLGGRDEAVLTLLALLKELTGEDYSAAPF